MQSLEYLGHLWIRWGNMLTNINRQDPRCNSRSLLHWSHAAHRLRRVRIQLAPHRVLR